MLDQGVPWDLYYLYLTCIPFPDPHEPHPSSQRAVLAQLPFFPPIRQLLSLTACREDIKDASEEQDLNYESQRLMKSMRSFGSRL